MALTFGQGRDPIAGRAEGGLAPQARLVALLDYMTQVERLNRKPAFVVPVEHFCVFEEELQSVPGVEFNLTAEGDEVWLRVPRLRELPPPLPEPLLAPWLDLPQTPDKLPKLVATPIIAAGSPAAAAAERPGADVLEAALHAYVRGPFAAWAREERARRRTIAIYGRLFILQQTMEADGADAPLELVWGLGVAQWKHPGGRICHPLITQLVEVTLDPQSLALEVRPRDRLPVLDTDVYTTLQIPETQRLANLWREHIGRVERPLSPFEPTGFTPILKAAVGFLDPQGSYWPESGHAPADRGLPAFEPRLIVTDTWVLFARKRSPNVLIEDLERLKVNVAALPAVPGGPAALVTAPATEVVERPLPFFRGLCFVEDHQTRRDARELFFTKPYNDEQVSVIQRLEVSDGVVVQGPPGTGKTHTIANVICHYLARGKKVLVTAKGDAALAVLREHIPPAIRPLAVALLTDEKDGMRQFEDAVQTIANTIARVNPRDLERDVRTLRANIDALHQKLASIDADIATFARLHMRRVRFGPKSLLPEELARHVVEKAAMYDWLPDRLTSRFTDPHFRDPDIAAARVARARLGAELTHMAADLPQADDLPDGEAMARAHEDLVRMREIEARLTADQSPAMAGRTPEILAQAHALQTLLRETIEQRERAEAAGAWTESLLALYRSGEQAALAPLDALHDTVVQLEADAQQFVERPVSLPPGAELDRELVEAVARAALGRSPIGMLPFGKGALRSRLAALAVAGLPPERPDEWAHIALFIEHRRQIHAAIVRWNAAAEAFSLPPIAETDAERFRTLSRHASQLGLCRRLPVEFEARLEALVAQVLDPQAVSRGLVHTREGLAALDAALVRHLAHARLAPSYATLSAVIAKLAGKTGRTADAMRLVLEQDLGNAALPANRIAVGWGELLAELRRLAGLREAYAEIARVADLVERSGAPQWALALRTDPAIGGTDRWTPHDWRDAWQWRQAATFLSVIDGRDALRRLQIERHETEQELARSYLALVERSTWLEVHRNSPPAVKAALQAYLNAVRYIGKGTGIRAARYRREARAAMLEAYRAVPCWIMPHWRVSETLPPEIGKFDLVVVDEASQSDLWALPCLLRGAKLMIVGDDKQVSPDGIGLAEDRIRDLKTRFLTDQVFGDQMTPEKSLYDLAKVVFSSELVVLREHFRCVAPIIEFSRREFYSDEIQPLRVPRASERLDPPLVDVLVRGAERRGNVNDGEARAIAAEIGRIIADPACANRTIGVVSLLGTEQAHRILQLIRDHIREEEIVARRITVGDARAFQGKERDIMLLSMVATPEAKMTATGAVYEQRFNVAASRARDRMVLFRSVALSDLNQIDLKARLIEHFASPFRSDMTQPDSPRDRCETGFERAMYDTLVELGYRVYTKVMAGAHPIDLVVEGAGDKRLAVECDGDQYHGPERWSADMARQRMLERAGWTFWRGFASSWVLAREAMLTDLVASLKAMGIEPGRAPGADETSLTDHREIEAAAQQ